MSNKDLKNISGTDWDALENPIDDEIDYSDIPPLGQDFFQSATLRIPAPEARNLVRLDSDVRGWFEQHSSTDYNVLVNQILRQYIQSAASSQAKMTWEDQSPSVGLR